MNGPYLASRVELLSKPVAAFREYLLRDVISQFGNIDVRASQVTSDYYNRIARLPAGEDETYDLADVAEAAEQAGFAWWEMMSSLRQSTLNLLAAGLFHLVEQQLAALSRDALFEGRIVDDMKISKVQNWYKSELGIKLSKLPSWQSIEQLHLVANTVKHGDGGETHRLRELRPELFVEPTMAALQADEGLSMRESMNWQQLAAPLAGEDFFVTEEILREYATAAGTLFLELAAELEKEL